MSTKKSILTNNNSTCINSINIVGLYKYADIKRLFTIYISLFIFIIAYQITRYCFKITLKITNKLLK